MSEPIMREKIKDKKYNRMPSFSPWDSIDRDNAEFNGI